MYVVHIINFLGEKESLTYKPNEYRNLMQLIVDKTGEEIGDCKGRAWCGTCHIKPIRDEIKEELGEDEENTLNGLHHRKGNSRLACQLMVDKSINKLTFKLLGDSEYA